MKSSVSYIDRTRELYDKIGYPPYAWFQAESAPAFTAMKRPLAECRLGMVSTAGTYVTGQTAFYYRDDTSIRKIPANTAKKDLRFSHITENYLVEARQDPRCNRKTSSGTLQRIICPVWAASILSAAFVKN
jgi:hypothetical protein